jgi:hypothetical protein
MRFGLKSVLLIGLALAGTQGAYAGLEGSPGPNGGADAGANAGGKAGDSECNYRDTLAKRESGGAGGYQADNKRGYIGKYQMGRSALIDTGYMRKNGTWTGKGGVWSASDFKNNGPEQERAQAAWEARLDSYTSNLGLNKYIGQSIPGCGKPLTQEGLRAAAHLVGPGGAMSYLQSGGTCGKARNTGLKYNTTDGNGTCAREYMCMTSGCSPVEKDMSKKTCDVTMPMIEAISCSNFSGELKSLCEYARPALMTRAECNAAESWAERAPKGPQKESCEGQTFGPGTGSWSYVLACSYMSEYVAGKPADADNDGVANRSSEPASDPQCYAKLKALGVDFKEMGNYHNGTGTGGTCVIQNAVSLRGTAIPFGSTQTMTCETAYAIETWGKEIRGYGITGYYDVGASGSGCRAKQDDRGVIGGKSEHGMGRAVDIGGFYLEMGGKSKVPMSIIRTPYKPEAQPVLRALKASCTHFDRVLSPTYEHYKTMSHVHLEKAGEGKCRV